MTMYHRCGHPGNKDIQRPLATALDGDTNNLRQGRQDLHWGRHTNVGVDAGNGMEGEVAKSSEERQK